MGKPDHSTAGENPTPATLMAMMGVGGAMVGTLVGGVAAAADQVNAFGAVVIGLIITALGVIVGRAASKLQG